MTTNGERAVENAAQRVLVVDDEPHILSAIQDLLEDDFAVLAVTDARRALDLLERQEVAVILSDQRMPGLSGDQFLREAQKRSHATRILITGYADLQALVRAVNEGKIYGYVAKPWDPKGLKELVSRAADYFRLVRELEYERNLLHTLMDHIPDGIYFKDTTSRFTRINRAQARGLGLGDPAEAVGRTDFDFLERGFAQEGRADEQQLLETGQPLIDKTEKVESPGGRARWVSTTKVPITDKSGKITGIIGISRDITERKQLEQQLAQAQKLEAVGRLAGGVAHDFNNLITIIGGYTEFLRRRLSADHPHHSSLQEIQKAADRGAGLIQQLLAFSRKQILEPRVLDLNAVVRDLEKMLGRLIGEDIELATNLELELGQVKADPGQIEQVLMNLAVNARDAMPRGGQLLIETRNAELDAIYAANHVAVKPGTYVLLEVSDTGIGMDAQTQAHIFEPFFTTKEPGQGTGLGLATVYGIVKQSEGYIFVYSEVGKGTSFKIYLPRIAEAATAVVGEEISQVARGRETVLVVEDEAPLRELMGILLREAGYAVLEASQGEEAVQCSAQHQGPIHLLVTDLVMPGVNGRELAKRLTGTHPDLKVLYMSGYSAEVVERQGTLEPGTLFLQKPFKSNSLLLKVREALAR